MTSDGLQSYCKYCYKITAAQSRVKKLEEEQASVAAATCALCQQSQLCMHSDRACEWHSTAQGHMRLDPPAYLSSREVLHRPSCLTC
jgi:hypothetical protein